MQDLAKHYKRDGLEGKWPAILFLTYNPRESYYRVGVKNPPLDNDEIYDCAKSLISYIRAD